MPLSSTGFDGTYKSDHNIYDKLGGTAEGKTSFRPKVLGIVTSLLYFKKGRFDLLWKRK